jgi:hypothetical protein
MTKRTTLLFFLALATPLLIAIWFLPWFVTQDGPLHLYNTHLLSALSDEHSLFNNFYAPRSGLLPYVGVYKLLAGLMPLVTARAADRVLMTLTSIGFASSVLWLRWRVTGSEGMSVVAPLVMTIAVSRLWLLGLYSFLLGACLFALTLGVWWIWRNDLKPVRATIIAILLALGYFFHVITTGLAGFALIVLAVATPGRNLRKRIFWTAASLSPSVVLMVSFAVLMKRSGGAVAEWIGLPDAFSIQSWLQYLQAPDFISFSFKESIGVFAVPTDCPFVEQSALSYAFLWPTVWAVVGVVLLVASSLRGRASRARLLQSEYRGWIGLAVCLFAAGFFGPSASGQGSILRERVLLLAMVTLVPLIKPQPKTSSARLSALCLAVAALLQLAFVLDYARISNRISGDVMQLAPNLESGQRIALMVPDPRTHYVVNPLPNIANQLGVSSDAVVWNNYAPAYYYFPVAFRSEQVRDQWKRLDSLNQLLLSGGAEAFARENPGEWVAALGAALDQTDVLIIWGAAPWFEAPCETWFQAQPFFERGELRAFRHR